MGTSTDYLLGYTDKIDFDSKLAPTADEQTVLESLETPALRERSVTEKDRALVYVDGNKRFEFPPTPEGYSMFQRLLDKATTPTPLS